MSGIIWVVIGVIITVAIFILYPNAFNTLVNLLKGVWDIVTSWVGSQNVTNLSGNLT